MISLLLNNNDEMNLKYKIKKYNEDKTVKRKYDKIILKAFTDFCKIEAKEKNDEKDIARDNLDVQITRLLLTDAEKLVDLKIQINDLSKNQLFNIITSVAKGIVQKQKEDNEKLTNEVIKVKEGYKKLFKNFKELKESNKKLTNEVTTVKESYNEIRENNKKLTNEVIKVKECYNELRKDNKKLSNEVTKVKESNKKLTNEVTTVKESNKKLTNEVTRIKESYNEIRKDNNKLSNELKEVREGYNKLIKYNDKLFEKYNELKSYSKKKIKELEEKYNGLAESYSDLYREVDWKK